jgi:hypothetical protein
MQARDAGKDGNGDDKDKSECMGSSDKRADMGKAVSR